MAFASSLRPLATRFGYRRDDGSFVFIGTQDQIILASHIDDTIAILRYCNGYATVEDIQQCVPEIDEEIFKEIIISGLTHGYLRDSRELYMDFHDISGFPLRYGDEHSPSLIRKLLEEDRRVVIPNQEVTSVSEASTILSASNFARALQMRRSTRAFESKAIAIPMLLALLRCMYWTGLGNRSTPSAGGLYPLQIHLATADPAQSDSPCLLRFDPTDGTLYRNNKLLSAEMLAQILDLPIVLNGYVIFVVAELSRSCAKYSNRGYRLAHLEAGHAAQNAYLFSAEQGLGVLEYAGFRDQQAAEILGLDYPHEAVLVTLIVGYEDRSGISQFNSSLLDRFCELKNQLVGPGKPVEWVEQIQFGIPPYELKRSAAVASYRDSTGKEEEGKKNSQQSIHRRCQGVSTSLAEAGIKAIAEAVERHASGCIHWDEIQSANELTSSGYSWLDPRRYVPYRSEHYISSLRHLKPFDPADTIQWVKGRRMKTGEEVYVPIDLVFYPVRREQAGRQTFYEACSSGVAAFPNGAEASQRALLELIERDAICVTWYSQKVVTAIPSELLRVDTCLRMERWAGLGWQSKCLNLTIDSLPVVLFIFWSERKRPHFVAGAAAATSFAEAANKAMDEAELMLAARRNTRRRVPNPSKVWTPLDHGLLFFELELLPEVEWLINAQSKIPQEVFAPNIVDMFDPIQVGILPEGTGHPLAVVRVLSDKLLPISFGYGTEHIGHPRLTMLGLEWKRTYPSIPHFFA